MPHDEVRRGAIRQTVIQHMKEPGLGNGVHEWAFRLRMLTRDGDGDPARFEVHGITEEQDLQGRDDQDDREGRTVLNQLQYFDAGDSTPPAYSLREGGH